jgi:DNA helicase-4
MISEELRNWFHRYFNFRSTLFAPFQNRELHRFQEYFDTVEKQPLTALQRRAVVLNDKRSLTIAGAGTGKTSVIVAKAGYLVKSGKCKPEDILLLAFNTDAAKELSERCKSRLGLDIRASTFHALGNQIISAVEAHPPSLTRLAQDRVSFSAFLDNTIEELRSNALTWRTVRTFVLAHLKPYKEAHEFKTLEEYATYVRSVELRALSGDLVKSFAELDIANFLFYNGIKFEYEKRYPHISERYFPDFYLPDYGIWIEHFGIDKNGSTAPYIDRERYHQEINWKRSIHHKNNTTLFETFSWQKSSGLLTRALNTFLKERGVSYAPLSQDDIFTALKNTGYITQLAILVESFLSQYKASQMSLAELDQRIDSFHNRARAQSFRELFVHFLERYQAKLDEERPREIDFNDMISDATNHIVSGRFQAPWKYIIVDEFQDISIGRFQLLDALLKSNKKSSLFAVGDDWQSINRFAGSDISIMRDFRSFFKGAKIVKLDHTFRFNSSIADVSGSFAQKNPSQIRKKLSTDVASTRPRVVLHWKNLRGKEPKSRAEQILDLVSTLARTVNEDEPSLLIVARYSHQLPNRQTLDQLRKLWPGTVDEPLTIHRAKGTEADYVIVRDLTADRYGFPAEMVDDPLMSLVLADEDDYPHAEERRLLYVALTRARYESHLLVDHVQPSHFALELRSGGYDVDHAGVCLSDDTRCPECRSGFILQKNDTLAGCSNYPFCEYIAPRCKKCGRGHLMPERFDSRAAYRCSNPDCHERAPTCPKCATGVIVTRRAAKGAFASCHRWPRCDYSASYKS